MIQVPQILMVSNNYIMNGGNSYTMLGSHPKYGEAGGELEAIESYLQQCLADGTMERYAGTQGRILMRGNAYQGGTYTVTLRIQDESGSPLAGQALSYRVDGGERVNGVTDAEGLLKIELTEGAPRNPAGGFPAGGLRQQLFRSGTSGGCAERIPGADLPGGRQLRSGSGAHGGTDAGTHRAHPGTHGDTGRYPAAHRDGDDCYEESLQELPDHCQAGRDGRYGLRKRGCAAAGGAGGHPSAGGDPEETCRIQKLRGKCPAGKNSLQTPVSYLPPAFALCYNVPENVYGRMRTDGDFI